MASSNGKRITQFVISPERGFRPGPASDDKPRVPAPAVTRPTKRRSSQGYSAYAVKKSPFGRDQNPWDFYETTMEVRLDMWVKKTRRRDGKDGVFAIRAFSQKDSGLILKRCKSLAHSHLVHFHEAFQTENTEQNLYIVTEYLPFCLDHLVACGEIPSDGELASIMGQILDALSYLHSQSLSHGSLKCSNTLVAFDGVVKIAGYWNCEDYHGSSKHMQDIKAAGFIMMQLMHDHQAMDGNIRVVDSQRSVEAVGFLADIESGLSAGELLKHEFLAYRDGKPKWNPGQLSGLVYTTAYSSQVCYKRQKRL
ncbi:hypothetical protein CNMCM5793_005722 [Aspergillus hiratsukae]|uniref:Protein kinase domain-containing protein n=1 Tax=Aspergillus hiratsukae TaxID=1194566 RepID=A0A8H6UGN2_9EURO|nr:hypothetical protein CNMCM5793_005722 [Aspergillus hiratsukae]KAF7172099.1 hypothetical protein CNMCM6106_006377 [Aspergillus hiratsukae]